MRSLAALAVALLLAAGLAWVLLRGQHEADGGEPLTGAVAGLGARELPTFDAAIETRHDGAPAAQAVASTPLAPALAFLTVRLPEDTSPAGDVFIQLASADGTWNDARLLRRSATWIDLPPGDYVLSSHDTGWSVPEAELTLSGGPTDVELQPANQLQGRVVEARSRRAPQGARLQVEGRVASSEGDASRRPLLAQPQPLVDSTFSIAGLGLDEDVDAVRARVTVEGGAEAISDWLPVAPQPFWSDVVLEVPDLAVRGHVTGAETPHPPLPGAHVALVPADVTIADVRFGEGELFLAPARAGDPARPTLASARAEDDGSYGLRYGAGPATARVLAWAEQRTPALSAPITLPANEIPDVPLALAAGSVLRTVVHVPARGADEGGGPRVDLRPMRIALEAADGRSVFGVTTLAEQLRLCASDIPGEAAFDARFEGLPAGDYLISALLVPEQGSDNTRTLRLRVHVPAGENVQVDLRPDDPSVGVHVRGTVVLPPGFALADGDVTLVRRGAPIDGATLPESFANLLADGTFDLRDVLPGDHVLAVRARNEARDALLLSTTPLSVGTADVDELRLDAAGPDVRVRAVPDLRDESLVLTSTTDSAELDAILALGHISLVVTEGGDAARIVGLRAGRYVLTPRKAPDRGVEFEVGARPVDVELR